jgi:thiamine biosynthesis lipoprotein
MATEAAPRAAVEQIMGMPISIHVVGRCDHDVDQAVDAVFDELRWVDRTFSTYRDDSDISRLGRGELTLEECDPAVAEVMAACDEARCRTCGLFDHRIAALDGTARLDPSGLVKSWGVIRAAASLRHVSDLSWSISAGGDVLCGSSEADPHRWRIGIEDPHDDRRLVGVVELTSGAVATSGTAHRGLHIVDPRTGEPADELASATVIGDDLVEADVLATCLVVDGLDAWERLARDEPLDLVAVDHAGGIHTTIEFGDHFGAG